MKFQIVKGETSVILTVFIQDSSSTIGAGLGSLDQTSSITGGYVKRNGTGVALTVDENVTTEGTYQAPTTAGQVRIGTPANMITGVYELHFHNDLFTTEDWVTISLSGATNMAPLLLEVQLVTNDPNTAINDFDPGVDTVTLGASGIPVGAFVTDSITSAAVTAAAANEIADAYLDRSNGIETGITPRQKDRLVLSASVGKLSGAATTTVAIRDTGDSKDRIIATADADGNRTAVTLDAT